jgi:hypothetical protein
MIKRKTYRVPHKLYQVIVGISSFSCFMMQSCASHNTYNYGGDTSKPATATNNNPITTEELRESMAARESQQQQRQSANTQKRESSKRQSSTKGSSPKRTGCLG